VSKVGDRLGTSIDYVWGCEAERSEAQNFLPPPTGAP